MSVLWLVFHIVEFLLWGLLAASAAYILFFALVSLLRKRPPSPLKAYLSGQVRAMRGDRQHSFLILFPAYGEDRVIVGSVRAFLQQGYPASRFHVAVISDHMLPETNDQLRRLPVTLLTPRFEKSSKARAMQYAMDCLTAPADKGPTFGGFDYVVILDADNVVETDFLSRLNECCQQGYQAIQCHRRAKNSDNSIAVLDGVSEEINNTIFRKAHNRVGLSSALIGSGMCFDLKWFGAHVHQLSTAGEDRELEALLLKERIYIHYEPDIHVFDEKVSSKDNFQRQRLRWMTAQVQSLCSMLPYIPKAIVTGNIDYIDKTIQQALIPRSMLIALTFVLAIPVTLVTPPWGVKWWLLFLFICLALYLSTPRQMRRHSVFGKLTALPPLAWKMVLNILKIDRASTDFIHTTHNKQNLKPKT